MVRITNRDMADHVYSPSSPIPSGRNQSEPSIHYLSRTRSAEIARSEMERLHAQHSLSLHAKVLGRTVGYEHFSSHINSLLRPCGNLFVMSLANGFFLLKFSDPSDYQKALQDGPWTINFCYIVLHPWVPNFKPSERCITKAKVWVRLYELPVEYYDKKALLTIAEAIAPLVKFDHVTEYMLKGKFARFCVELDFKNPLPDFVKLPNGFLQQVRYEGLENLLCYGCRRVGHVRTDCRESTYVDPEQAGPVVVPSDVACSHLPGHPAAASASRFAVIADDTDDDHDIPGLNVPDQGYTVNAPEDSESAQFKLREGIASLTLTQTRTPPQDATPESPAPSLPILQIPEQEATLIRTSSVDVDYFLNQVCSYAPVPDKNSELMSPGSKFKHQVILRGVKEPVVLRDSVEIQETRNAGLPKVFAINPEVRTFSINVLIDPSGDANTYRTFLTPIGHPSFGSTPSPAKRFVLYWNSRGARDHAAIQALKDLIEKYSLYVVVLTETKTGRIEAKKVIGELGFSGSFIIEPVENSGGVWILWDEDRVNVEVQAHGQNYVWALALASAPVLAENWGDSWTHVFGVDDC